MSPKREIPPLTAEQYIELKKIKAETKRKIAKEETKRKREEEETKRKREEEETKRKKIEEEEETKRHELDLKRQQLYNMERIEGRKSASQSVADIPPLIFYNDHVSNKFDELKLDDLLESWSDIDDELVKIFEDEFNKFKQVTPITETLVQDAVNTGMEALFSSKNCSTSLQYMNTSARSGYLMGKRPDCTFIYKNLNIRNEYQCLQDFVICIGELKSPGIGINNIESIGQLCQYLTLLLIQQNREKIYGFLFNLKQIRFYCAERIDASSYKYYRSEPLNFLPTLQVSNSKSKQSSVSNTKSNMSTSSVEVATSKNTEINKETIKKLIKFLTMKPAFYKYTMLNINPDDYLYKNEFYIKNRLGSGVSSIVYALYDNNDDLSTHAIKISNSERFDDMYKNEIRIWRKLKAFTDSKDKFNLFFRNIFNVPADDAQVSGRFIVFENILQSLPSMQKRHALQLIDIVEHLYYCRIIHRDIRPDNLMYDARYKHVKLIDFGFAETFEKNENTKRLKIAGVISYSTLKLLEIYSNGSNAHSSKYYEYERTFDLSCAINVIMYLKDVYINQTLDKTKHEDEKEKFKKIKDFWRGLIHKNEHYGALTKLIEDFSEASSFDAIKKEIDENF